MVEFGYSFGALWCKIRKCFEVFFLNCIFRSLPMHYPALYSYVLQIHLSTKCPLLFKLICVVTN